MAKSPFPIQTVFPLANCGYPPSAAGFWTPFGFLPRRLLVFSALALPLPFPLFLPLPLPAQRNLPLAEVELRNEHVLLSPGSKWNTKCSLMLPAFALESYFGSPGLMNLQNAGSSSVMTHQLFFKREMVWVWTYQNVAKGLTLEILWNSFMFLSKTPPWNLGHQVKPTKQSPKLRPKSMSENPESPTKWSWSEQSILRCRGQNNMLKKIDRSKIFKPPSSLYLNYLISPPLGMKLKALPTVVELPAVKPGGPTNRPIQAARTYIRSFSLLIVITEHHPPSSFFSKPSQIITQNHLIIITTKIHKTCQERSRFFLQKGKSHEIPRAPSLSTCSACRNSSTNFSAPTSWAKHDVSFTPKDVRPFGLCIWSRFKNVHKGCKPEGLVLIGGEDYIRSEMKHFCMSWSTKMSHGGTSLLQKISSLTPRKRCPRLLRAEKGNRSTLLATNPLGWTSGRFSEAANTIKQNNINRRSRIRKDLFQHVLFWSKLWNFFKYPSFKIHNLTLSIYLEKPKKHVFLVVSFTSSLFHPIQNPPPSQPGPCGRSGGCSSRPPPGEPIFRRVFFVFSFHKNRRGSLFFSSFRRGV